MLIDSISFGKLNFFSKGELPSMGIPVMYKEVVEMSFLNFNGNRVNLSPVYPSVKISGQYLSTTLNLADTIASIELRNLTFVPLEPFYTLDPENI